MQKKTRTLCLLGVGLAVVATAALAASPKFLRAPSAQLGSPKVIVTWTEVGLGLTDSVHYRASADADARYQCVNRGNNCPAASNKQDVFTQVSVDADFFVENGRITAQLDIPAPESTLQCPSGQVAVVARVKFTNILLEDETNSISSATKPSSLEYKIPECP
jgi:hypothetical protein